MIFDNNSTALGSIDIPVVEGYDCSTGAARALIESARNDYAMFNAMLKVDFREAHIERAGADNYVTEGELTSLTEATANGIWQKIKDLFKSLIAKIKDNDRKYQIYQTVESTKPKSTPVYGIKESVCPICGAKNEKTTISMEALLFIATDFANAAAVISG